jgi:hypothetical protein
LKERLKSLAIESSAEFSVWNEFNEPNPTNIVGHRHPGSAKGAHDEARSSTTIEESQVVLSGQGKGKDLLKRRP